MLRKFVVKEPGAIQNIAKLYVQCLKAEAEVGLQSSLAPCDVKHASCSDSSLPETQWFQSLLVEKSGDGRLAPHNSRHPSIPLKTLHSYPRP